MKYLYQSEYLKPLIDLCIEHNVNYIGVMEQFGIDWQAVNSDKSAPYKLDHLVALKLINTLVSHTNDNLIGIKLGQKIELDTNLAYIFTFGNSLEAIYAILNFYLESFGSATYFSYKITENDLYHKVHYHFEEQIDTLQNAMISISHLIEILKSFGDYSPVRIYLSSDVFSNKEKAALEQHFQCPVQYNAAFNGIKSNKKHVYQNFFRKIELPNHAKKYFINLLTNASNVAQLVTTLIEIDIRYQVAFSKQSIASQLGVHPKVLELKLKQESTNYREISNRSKINIACSMLLENRYSMQDISNFLQYHHQGNFSHAFVKYTGISPSQFIENNKLKIIL